MSIPYRFRVEGFFRYENSDRHEKEIQEQAKRDARDQARLRVEKDVFWVGLLGLAGLLFTLGLTRISTEAVTKQFELSERPWVAVDLVKLDPDEPQVWYFIELPKGATRINPVGFRKDALGSYAY